MCLCALSFLKCKSRIDLACVSFLANLLYCPFLHFLSSLRSIPALVFPLTSLHKNHIYLNKYSPGNKHWLSGSAFLTGFLYPDPDPDTQLAWSKRLLRNKRQNGCTHPLQWTGPFLGVSISCHAIMSWTRALDLSILSLTAVLPRGRWWIFLYLSWPVWDPLITCGNQVLAMWLVRLGAELLLIYLFI